MRGSARNCGTLSRANTSAKRLRSLWFVAVQNDSVAFHAVDDVLPATRGCVQGLDIPPATSGMTSPTGTGAGSVSSPAVVSAPPELAECQYRGGMFTVAMYCTQENKEAAKPFVVRTR